jgi:hypothetical protein
MLSLLRNQVYSEGGTSTKFWPRGSARSRSTWRDCGSQSRGVRRVPLPPCQRPAAPPPVPRLQRRLLFLVVQPRVDAVAILVLAPPPVLAERAQRREANI